MDEVTISPFDQDISEIFKFSLAKLVSAYSVVKKYTIFFSDISFVL
jgi:hypothetical protein